MASRLMFAADIWVKEGTMTQRNRDILSRPQWLTALRTIRGYRRVSGPAAAVLAGMIPADLMAREKVEIKSLKRRVLAGENLPYCSETEATRRRTVETWQNRWQLQTSQAAWTRKILPNITGWLNGPYRKTTTYHMTQFLTGHGCFRHYLWKKKRASSGGCLYCLYPEDTAGHTVIECSHWDRYRELVRVFLQGRDPVEGDIEDLLCGPRQEVLPESGDSF